MRKQILKFGSIGIAGYVVDCSVLYACLIMVIDPLVGRIFSFICAVVTTWLLNRRLTFPQKTDSVKSSLIGREATRYFMAMSLGGAINILIYNFIVRSVVYFDALPAIGIAVGSVFGMSINFTLAKYWVYRNSPTSPP